MNIQNRESCNSTIKSLLCTSWPQNVLVKKKSCLCPDESWATVKNCTSNNHFHAATLVVEHDVLTPQIKGVVCHKPWLVCPQIRPWKWPSLTDSYCCVWQVDSSLYSVGVNKLLAHRSDKQEASSECCLQSCWRTYLHVQVSVNSTTNSKTITGWNVGRPSCTPDVDQTANI